MIRTIYFLTQDYTKSKEHTTKKLKTKHKAKLTNIQAQCKQVNKPLCFKCEAKGCSLHIHKCKELNAHYRSVHEKKLKCTKCKKTYDTLYGLKQHSYKHSDQQNNFSCKRCGLTFPFKSQLLIHLTKHTQSTRYECSECSLLYKYKHNMLKHMREHWAKLEQCSKCEYTRIVLNLKAHVKQHNAKSKSKCNACKQTFVHCMSLWRHRKTCKLTGKTTKRKCIIQRRLNNISYYVLILQTLNKNCGLRQ